MSRYEPFVTTQYDDPDPEGPDVYGILPLLTPYDEDEAGDVEIVGASKGAKEEDEALEAEIEPGFRELAVSSDADMPDDDPDGLQSLEQDLSPGEAEGFLNYMRPLTEQEADLVLDPMFSDLRWVDDPVHTDDVLASGKDSRRMDRRLVDATYGEAAGHKTYLPSRERANAAVVPPSPQVMMLTIQRLAKLPGAAGDRAREALSLLAMHANPQTVEAGMLDKERALAVMGLDAPLDVLGDDLGFGLADAFSVAMKPITVPAKYAWKATKWTGRKLGITKGGHSPEQVRLDRIRASQKRIAAAQARARAADADSEAEYRTQQQLAAAADAEADAADAEANVKEAVMRTAEAQYMPGQTSADEDQAEGDARSLTVAEALALLAEMKARQLTQQDARTGVRRSAQARALVAGAWARQLLRSRGIAA